MVRPIVAYFPFPLFLSDKSMRERTTDSGLVIKLQIEPAPKAAKTVPLVPLEDPVTFFKESNLKAMKG